MELGTRYDGRERSQFAMLPHTQALAHRDGSRLSRRVGASSINTSKFVFLNREACSIPKQGIQIVSENSYQDTCVRLPWDSAEIGAAPLTEINFMFSEPRPKAPKSLDPMPLLKSVRSVSASHAEQPSARPSLSSIQMPVARISRAKRSFNARHLMPVASRRLLQGEISPSVGDLVLAQVVEIGHHAKLQTPNGRRSEMYVGDEIVVAYGDRYAPSQWEARVPEDLGECHLAAGGGLASRITEAHPRMKPPTVLQPIGLLADSRGHRINLKQFSLTDPGRLPSLPPTIVILGTSMDSGKTTAAASIINGLSKAGLRVGAAKVTGTGACGDLMKFEDAGAAQALDFVDAGLPTTYLQPLSEIQRIVRTLLGALVENGAEALVVEVADGLLQGETAGLLATQALRDLGMGVVFAARDSLAAIEGERRLVEQDYDVRAISGVVSASPLSCNEIACSSRAAVLSKEQLSKPEIAMDLLRLKNRRAVLSR